MFKSKCFISLSTIFLLLILVISVFSFEVIAQSPKIPEMIKIGIHKVGTGGHRTSSVAIEAIIDKYDVAIRGVPQGSSIARNIMGVSGTVDIVTQASMTLLMMNEGLLEYNKPEWGPQPIRGIYFPSHPGLVFTVLEDSDIYNFEDLKGKRVPNLITSPASNWMITAMLAYGGLTREDVVNVDTTSTSTAYNGVRDGRLDVSYFNVTSPNSFEIDATYGIRYLGMPPNTEEGKKGWERVYKDFPGFSPKLATRGCKLSKDNPTWVLTMGNNIWFAWPNVNQDITYFMAKALTESYDKYSTNDPSLEGDWSVETHWANWEGAIGQIPLAEGAIRYYKEVGMWNDKREKINQERLKHQEELQSMWDNMIQEATEKDIQLNAKNLEKMWYELREEKGLFTP